MRDWGTWAAAMVVGLCMAGCAFTVGMQVGKSSRPDAPVCQADQGGDEAKGAGGG